MAFVGNLGAVRHLAGRKDKVAVRAWAAKKGCAIALQRRGLTVRSMTSQPDLPDPLSESTYKSSSISTTQTPASKTIASLASIIALDRVLAWSFQALQIPIPSSLFGLSALFALLLLLDGNNQELADKIYATFEPAATFFSKWLAVFFVPSLVMLPNAALPGSADFFKVGVVIVIGWLLSLLGVAWWTLIIQRIIGKKGGAVATTAGSYEPAPYAKVLKTSGVATVVAFIAAAAGKGVQGLYASYTLALTLFGFCVGNQAPKSLKTIVHPLIICTLISIGGIWAYGKVAGMTFTTVLGNYVTRSKTFSLFGGGDFLLYLLGPAVISFAIQMYARRRLIRERKYEVFGATLSASLNGLFGTAYFARFMGCSDAVRMFLIPRQLTAPLAMRTAEIIGADVGLALSVVVLTGLMGANFAKITLDTFNIKDPAARGLATGSSAHGLGTAALTDEPDAFAFSAVAMALVALMSTSLVCVPFVRSLLIRVALGAAA
mmetsp:Transcript_10174/g.31127  ORF Transcript_10174/g.31127 Transcript_10174/m.31127 type:complete len:490 (-) Transcript_10174:512-1981(-)|eukprot:CAMPEP_0198730224 /NCGR_PEP_ID=MMETSP1475-20131203/23483_1 /TAXON_ID= ORGANISM="Unidentified sp., Strain CCMP1999" /NCGR_SAMPLE_ID=MMETSP1475 /ASSEMBLY_ACC=CAM_ASM_001111 /LENGTH=489 /DNA_ID=CAMNT_0044493009 /DNA_START=72 /DNA_END=1541 /DNA_ORIENTATION=-